MTTVALTSWRELDWVHTALKVLMGALVLSIASKIEIFLPFTPVPISITQSVALCMGIILGPVVGAAAVLTYLFEGVCGLPVFSGGRFGPLMLVGPTGGYLIGYVFGAFASGWVMLRCRGSRSGMLLAYAAGGIPLYLSGVAVLSAYVGWSQVLIAGVLPYLPGFVLKGVAFTSIIPRRLMAMRHG